MDQRTPLAGQASYRLQPDAWDRDETRLEDRFDHQHRERPQFWHKHRDIGTATAEVDASAHPIMNCPFRTPQPALHTCFCAYREMWNETLMGSFQA